MAMMKVVVLFHPNHHSQQSLTNLDGGGGGGGCCPEKTRMAHDQAWRRLAGDLYLVCPCLSLVASIVRQHRP